MYYLRSQALSDLLSLVYSSLVFLRVRTKLLDFPKKRFMFLIILVHVLTSWTLTRQLVSPD